MNSLLSDLYNGKVSPLKQYEPVLHQYHEKEEEIFQVYQKFCDKLDTEKQEEFRRLFKAQMDGYPMKLEQSFSDGIRMGAKFMCEVFMHEDVESYLKQHEKGDNNSPSRNGGRYDKVAEQRDIIRLIEWIADNHSEWVRICEGEQIGKEECIGLINLLLMEGFVQLVPVVLTRSMPSIDVDNMMTKLFLLKLADSWRDKDYSSIAKEFWSIADVCTDYED